MTKRKKYTPQFKARVVRELLEGEESLGSVASKYGINPNMLYKWRRELLDNASVVFSQEKQLREAKKIEEEHRLEVDNLLDTTPMYSYTALSINNDNLLRCYKVRNISNLKKRDLINTERNILIIITVLASALLLVILILTLCKY